MTGPPLDATQPIAVDAFTGDSPVIGQFAKGYGTWALGTARYGRPYMRPRPKDPANWRDNRIGWGIVLPERAGLSHAQLATAADAPKPIQKLVKARKGKVLRYRPGTSFGDWTLRDYTGGDRLIAASPVGTGPNDVPQYLLIYATPADVPWHIQYALNPVRYVGRLDLTGQALNNYVTALLDGWSTASSTYHAPVVWAVDHGAGDITALMRNTVAAPIYDKLAHDGEMNSAIFIDGSAKPATIAALASALTANKPALIVTSSHGLTGPLSDTDAMRATLGLPVDHAHQALVPDELLAHWQPDGAIWFAQACCSAGSDSPTEYAGLFEPGTLLDRTLTGIAQAGATTAPLARALLGAAKPLRAFIGHIEPTFNWTLSFPPNQQALTDDLQTAIYTRLCDGQPVGLAMNGYYPAIASQLQSYEDARRKYETTVGPEARPSLDMLVYSRVTAHDRASTVILGDPTVAIPLPE